MSIRVLYNVSSQVVANKINRVICVNKLHYGTGVLEGGVEGDGTAHPSRHPPSLSRNRRFVNQDVTYSYKSFLFSSISLFM